MKNFHCINTTLQHSRRLILFISLITLCVTRTYAAPAVKITDTNFTFSLAHYLDEYIDHDSVSSLNTVLLKNFTSTKGASPIYGNNVTSAWLRFKALNGSSSPSIFLNIAYTDIEEVTLYKLTDNAYTELEKGGNAVSLIKRIFSSPNMIFNLKLLPGEEGEYIIHINSRHPIIFPAFVSTPSAVANFNIFQTFIISIYLGVLSIMFFYNLFLYFSTADNNYLFYIIYIFFLAFAQFTASGYSYKYLWPHYPEINKYAVIWTSSFSTITAVLFSMYFLQTAKSFPKAHLLLKGVIAIYIAGLLFSAFGRPVYSYNILNYNSLLCVVTVLIVSVHLTRKGFRPALFYLIAWLALLLSLIVLVFRNLNLFPYNSFTAYIFYIGSAVEVALLSLALADKINILKKEKEISQAESLKISRENEQLVKEQNVMLERKVAERTEELQNTNEQLSIAFKDLKGAQIQLVEAEKMASLGQLTAGIAHEINNPINFVKSNIKPLQLDFKDIMEIIDEYGKLHTADSSNIVSHLKEIEALKKDIGLDFIKDEIESLMTGIENGAERTAEIVRGLRNFSRLDESVIKTVNIHEGIDSTLILLRSNIPVNITVVKEYNALGEIECFPGKLNQVFMNILSNAIHAITAKKKMCPEEKITITTTDTAANGIEIRIVDTGKGMSEEVKQKIYDPFFTTKDVGEGTGLGMAIVFNIIKEHSGKIEVITEEGKGTEFIITLNNIVPGKPII
jgi:two-component system NtrC family sensor kinase